MLIILHRGQVASNRRIQVDLSGFTRWFLYLLKNSKIDSIYAIEDGKVVGFMSFQGGYIGIVEVHSSCRGRKVGQAMVAHYQDVIRRKDRSARLECLPDSRGFWEKMGFFREPTATAGFDSMTWKGQPRGAKTTDYISRRIPTAPTKSLMIQFSDPPPSAKYIEAAAHARAAMSWLSAYHKKRCSKTHCWHGMRHHLNEIERNYEMQTHRGETARSLADKVRGLIPS